MRQLTAWLVDRVLCMPARSNAFQEMVALLTQVMREDESIKVTPSALLPDVITGNSERLTSMCRP